MLHLGNLVPCTINFQMFIQNRTLKKIRLKETFLSAMLHNILEVICDFYPKACWGKKKKNCSKISTIAKLSCRFILYMAMQFDAQDISWKCLLRHAVFNFKVNMANT